MRRTAEPAIIQNLRVKISKMPDKNQIQVIVFRAIDRLNEVLLEENAIAKDRAEILFGEGAQLDSMGFVNLGAALEEELGSELGIELNVAEEMNSPEGKSARIITVGDLVDFLSVRIEKRALNGGRAG
jgi:acyl carrier protein